MELIGNTETLRKLNTKGCCFLCLQSENIVKTEEPEANQVLKSTCIRQLLRHLQILTAQSSNEKLMFGHGFKQDIQVDLCENCGHVISRFSVLFQKLEKIRLEMDYFLEGIHKCISQSSKDPELVQNYSKRMTSDLEALSQLAFVDHLRKEVAKESLRNATVPSLHVILTRADIQPIKTENSEEVCESNDRDIPGNYFPDEISPPPSPTATFDHEEDEKFSISLASTSQENKKFSPSIKPPDKQKSKKSKFYTKNVPTGMYECNGCDKKSKSRATIEYHFKCDHLKIRYKCDICNVFVFKQLSKLSRHKKTCRQNMEKKLAKEKDPKFKFICKICGKRFAAKQNLASHCLDVHKNIDRYPCDLCDRKFKKSSDLKYHRDAVHLLKRFNCGFCSKSFSYKADLRTHERKCANKLSLKEGQQQKIDVVNKELN